MPGDLPQTEQASPRRIRFEPVTAAMAREVLTWRYDPPYDFYDPPHALTETDLTALLSPESPHFGVFDEHDRLIGFIGLGREAQVPGGDYSAPALDIGIGLRPDQTGQGLGRIVLTGFFEHLIEQGYPPAPLRATIATFNLRSQRTFLHLGFQETARFRTGPEDATIEWVILTAPAVSESGVF
jgi:RimJ/RimL family protein N-acetyltransferase